mmetsp:Transcript_4313/g.3617  ORF Transcript_4313/g.3617 Transcript_4313/m.3617 type:complete len:209 (+) Transcript_4313:244-870(+)
MVKDQQILIQDSQVNEKKQLNKIADLEKKLEEANHKLEIANLDHKKEVSSLKIKLEKKDNIVVEEMENFIMNKLDLDSYNITSDDFRLSRSERVKDAEVRSRSTDDIKKNNKNHPNIPILNFQKIYDWREKANNDNVIMIRISDSRIIGEDDVNEEVDDEDGLEAINKTYFGKGDPQLTSPTRVDILYERKQMIINALNQAYSDDEEQ